MGTQRRAIAALCLASEAHVYLEGDPVCMCKYVYVHEPLALEAHVYLNKTPVYVCTRVFVCVHKYLSSATHIYLE